MRKYKQKIRKRWLQYYSEESFNFFPLILDASNFDKPAVSVAEEVEKEESEKPGGGEFRFDVIFY